MRAGEDPANNNPANKTARDQAFERMTSLLKALPAKHASTAAPHTSTTARKAKASVPKVSCHDEATGAAL